MSAPKPPTADPSKYRATIESDDKMNTGSNHAEDFGSESQDDAASEVPILLADLHQRIILEFNGYDTKNLKIGEPLDDAAVKLLYDKNTRKRMVFRSWPRDPKGKYITPDNSFIGKMTSNACQLWGATLADFYRVRRIPDLPGLSTISSGSKLAGWMKNNGELEFAPEEIARTEREEEPKQVPAFEIAELISSYDLRIKLKAFGKSLLQPEGKGDVKMGKISEAHPRHSSMFDPSSYPAPWPLVPFSYEPPRLQKRIPLRLLPQKLIVHDPWNLLEVDSKLGDSDADSVVDDATAYKKKGPTGKTGDWTTEEWLRTPDIMHEYHLSLSSKGLARLETEEKDVSEARSKTGVSCQEGFLLLDEGAEAGPIAAPVFVELPAEPPRERIEESHLYISPEFAAGKGNHSVVYHVDWEVPRSMLMPPALCRECIMEDVKKILEEEDGEDGSKMTEKWKGKPSILKKTKQVRDSITDGEQETHYSLEVEGPVRRIKSRVSWSSANDPNCRHCVPIDHIHPRTTKVRLTAKLSLQDDRHLQREAENYQAFPDHFFEHWNGYNILPPSHDPTPVGAIVPQFYGMYKPTKDDEANYLSPILLLEDCGVPVDPETLNIDDNHECCSLYYRFHHGGWGHGSIAQRNILVAPGPISAPPLLRALRLMDEDRPTEPGDLTFRLIDFGRSRPDENGDVALMERGEVSRLFFNSPF